MRRYFSAVVMHLVLAGLLLFGFSLQSPAEELPEPLTLEAALANIPTDLPAERLSSEYQDVAIRARVFDCRSQDSVFHDPTGTNRNPVGCGFWHLLSPQQQTRLDVLRRFLDVLEADLAAAKQDEAMAVTYVELDRARNREELGQYSSLTVEGMDADYQEVRFERSVSIANQRVTRALLVTALGRPDQLPSDVATPEFGDLPKDLGELKPIVDKALGSNPVINRWRKRVESEESASTVVRQLELDLRQSILELWIAYPSLRVARERDLTRELFRDTWLDRSRTLYELEAKADLGDAMTEQTAARLEGMKSDHRLVMLLATLNALRGRPLLPLAEEKKK